MKKLFLCLNLFASSMIFADEAPQPQNTQEQDDVAYVGEPGRELERRRPGVNPGGARRGINPRGPRRGIQGQNNELPK